MGKLTAVGVKQAKPEGKPYKLTDGGGLFLLVHPSGGKRWRFKYRYAGKEKLLAALRRIEARGATETVHRVKQTAGQVFRYTVATGRADRYPSGDLKGALKNPEEKHLAAITEPTEAGRLTGSAMRSPS